MFTWYVQNTRLASTHSLMKPNGSAGMAAGSTRVFYSTGDGYPWSASLSARCGVVPFDRLPKKGG